MKGGKTPLGYTIIEVLIAMAVSGLMFVIAANFISGKQEKSSFSAGVNETASQMQDVIEQVTDGQYSDIPKKCTSNGTNIQFPSAGGQGTNSPCVFLGKFLHFWPLHQPEQYVIISAAGTRLDAADKPITDITLSAIKNIPDFNVSKNIPQSLYVDSTNGVTGHDIAGTSVTDSYVFGFVQSLASSNGAGGISSGAHAPPQLYAVTHNAGPDKNTNAVQNQIKEDNLTQMKDVTICLTNGSRRAKITIGSNNNQLSVGVKMLGVVAKC